MSKAAQAFESFELKSEGVEQGTVIAFDRNGRPLVRCGRLPAPLCCDVLDIGLGPCPLQLGDTVAFMSYRGRDDAGCVLGRVAGTPRASSRTKLVLEALELDVDELVITAKSKLTLATDRARVRLTKQGDLELLAVTLVSKARRLQKLLAPMLRLN